MGTWIGLIWLWIRKVKRFCECNNKPQGSIKFGELLDYLRIYYLLKDSAPWTSQRWVAYAA
jgi:hypothetical protein